MKIYLVENCDMYPAAERSMDKLILYFCSDNATFSIIPPKLLCRFHTLFSPLGVGGTRSIDVMIKELYLAGGDKFSREEMCGYMDLFLADCEEAQFKSDLKFNALFSYLLQQSVDYYHQEGLYRGKLFIDSGAFSAWTQGKPIDVDKYIDWINERSDFIELYGQVDTIPASITQTGTRDVYDEAARKTWENYLYMRPKMKNPDGLLYTYHVGEPIKYLKQALEWTDENGKHIPYIALGGSVGKPAPVRRKFFDTCFKAIRESSNPDVKVHAFGMTDLELLESYPITSADSTSWIMVGAMGNIMTDYGVIGISKNQSGDKKHYSNLPKEAWDKITEAVNKFGFTIDDLSESRKNRIMYNAMYMIDRVSKLDNTKYHKVSKRKLF